jgi:hypothetical protein
MAHGEPLIYAGRIQADDLLGVRDLLRREIEEAEKTRRGALQLTPQALERRLEGLVEKLRSGATGRVREAIRVSVASILVSAEGLLTLEGRPEGLLGAETSIAHLGCRGGSRTLTGLPLRDSESR